MNKLGLAKGAVKFVVSIGASAIVGNAIKATTPITTKPFKGLCIQAATFVLKSMVAIKVNDYVDQEIDDLVKTAEKLKEPFSGILADAVEVKTVVNAEVKSTVTDFGDAVKKNWEESKAAQSDVDTHKED